MSAKATCRFHKCKPETAYLKSFKSRENDLIKSNSLSQAKNYLWCLFCEKQANFIFSQSTAHDWGYLRDTLQVLQDLQVHCSSYKGSFDSLEWNFEVYQPRKHTSLFLMLFNTFMKLSLCAYGFLEIKFFTMVLPFHW